MRVWYTGHARGATCEPLCKNTTTRLELQLTSTASVCRTIEANGYCPARPPRRSQCPCVIRQCVHLVAGWRCDADCYDVTRMLTLATSDVTCALTARINNGQSGRPNEPSQANWCALSDCSHNDDDDDDEKRKMQKTEWVHYSDDHERQIGAIIRSLPYEMLTS